MKGKIIHYKKIGLKIGEYFQVHKENTHCNNNIQRTKGAT